MAQVDLWDGLVPTKTRLMERTIAWGNTLPTVWPTDAWFWDIDDKTLKQYNGTQFNTVVINEEEFKCLSVGF